MSPADDKRLEIALRYLAERRARPGLEPRAFLDEVRASDPALRGYLDAQLDELLAEVTTHAPEEAERRLRSRAAFEPASTVPLDPEHRTERNAPSGADADTPSVIDRRYKVIRKLGEGGQGQVLLVEDTYQQGQKLALKLVRREHVSSPEVLQRFKNEILLQRELVHPGIPRVFNDGLTEHGEYYYTMAYVEGRTLADLIHKEAPLHPARVVRLTRQILDVLDYAHGKGAIHRDLKPGNVFVVDAGTPRESVRVLDFGIAKLLQREGLLEHALTMHTEVAIGTPHYMAPEQVANDRVDSRTDLYALGIIVYQMCSGRLPFQGDTALEVAAARLTRAPAPLKPEEAPPWLTDLVMRLLAKEREKRPDTHAVRVALDALVAGQRRLQRLVRALAAVVGALAVVAALVIWRPKCQQEVGPRSAPAPLASLKLNVPREVWVGQQFWIELVVGQDRAASGARPVLTTPLAREIPGLRRIETMPDATAGAARTIEIAGGGSLPATAAGEQRERDATFDLRSVRRCYVAERAGTISIAASRLDLVPPDAEAPERSTATFPEFAIAAQPLPPGAPAGFGGAIGRFVASAKVWPPEVEEGGEIELALTWSGEGNLDTFELPDLASQAGFDAFRVTRPSAAEDRGGRSWNERSATWKLAPRSLDVRQVPAVALVAFDPESARYVTVASDAIGITVKPRGEAAKPDVDADRDGDGTPDRSDGCPDDAKKTAAGRCGCGTPDEDSDGDGTPDCVDGCPNDPLKTAAGACGCGVFDTDSDGDGVLDCHDAFPADPTRSRTGEQKVEAFEWLELEPLAGATIPAGAATFPVRGRSSRPLRRVKIGSQAGTIDAEDRARFHADVDPAQLAARDGGRTLELVVEATDDLEGKTWTERRELKRELVKLPEGCAVADGSAIGAGGLATRVRHERTKIVLRLVGTEGGANLYVGEREVSWDEYEQNAGKLPRKGKPTGIPDVGRHPATDMTFADAQDFARRNGFTLPSTTDWLRAASQDAYAGADVYPWGAGWKAKAANAQDAGLGRTAPCGSFPQDVSWCGVLDLAGNVREWCTESEDGTGATLRGGSYESDAAGSALGFAPRIVPEHKETIGFRVALEARP